MNRNRVVKARISNGDSQNKFDKCHFLKDVISHINVLIPVISLQRMRNVVRYDWRIPEG